MANCLDYTSLIGEVFGKLEVIEVGRRVRREDSSQGSRQYLVVRCKCGTTKEVRYENLRRKDAKATRSCGCIKAHNLENLKKAWAVNPKKNLAPGVAERNLHFRHYKHGAATRGYLFELTLDEFGDLIKQPCHYCGELASPVNGIDRKDNTQGYTPENCLPCCWTCNCAKGTQSYEDFMGWINRMIVHQTQVI